MAKLKVRKIYQRYGSLTVYVVTSRAYPGVVAKSDSRERAIAEFMRKVGSR